MKILVVGGSGLIGKAVKEQLELLNHEVITASRNHSDYQVDLADHNSIEKLYQQLPKLDAVISAPGSHIKMAPLSNLTIDDYAHSLKVKALGQIDLVLTGQKYLNEGGSFTLTTGILTTDCLAQTSCVAVVNNAVEGFVRCSAFELSRRLRLNAVSPNVIREALVNYSKLFVGYEGVSLKSAALAYVRAALGIMNGTVIVI